MSEGMSDPQTFDDSMNVLIQHIEHIHTVTNSYDHIGFGTDLDGFIKPTLPGFEKPQAFAEIEARLIDRYGTDIAERICSGNAMRVLRQVWQKPIKLSGQTSGHARR